MKNTADKFEIGMKFDHGKPNWSLLPLECVEDIVKILSFGAEKYGRDNWKKLSSKEDIDRIFSALMRHLVASRNGELTDSESGMSHLAHALTNMIFLLYNEKHNK